MANAAKPIPDGFHSLTPYLCVKDAARAMEFYKRAFGAKEIIRMDGPQGKIMHAELKIGDSILMLADEFPGGGLRSPQTLSGSTASVFVYVEDVDSVFKNALSAGAREDQPLQNQFWGDRYGRLTDPFGHSWSLATHVEDISPEEMGKRIREATAKAQQQAKAAG